MTKNGIKIGFLGYCEFETDYNFKNCSEMRLLFNTGPAVYRDDIATRDVQRLKEVIFSKCSISFVSLTDVCTISYSLKNPFFGIEAQ